MYNAGICGQVKYPQSDRIVGGVEAVPHEFPWYKKIILSQFHKQSNLFYRQAALNVDNAWFCGATLISADWILTAAHCTDGGSSFEITLGAHNKDIIESSQVTIVSTDFTMHPNWNPKKFQNDIALIKLPSPITFILKLSSRKMSIPIIWSFEI